MYSMTGFARAHTTHLIDDQSIGVEVHLKGVNGKGCEVNVRIPHAFSSFEIEIIRYLKARFKRGTISCSFWLTGHVSTKNYEISLEHAQRYKHELENLKKSLDLASEIGLRDVVSLPGVIISTETPTTHETYENAMRTALEEAATAFEKELAREGREIQSTILEHIVAIEKIFQSLRSRLTFVIETRKNKLHSLAQEACKGDSPSSTLHEALAIELFRILEKNDISEEIQRFESHLQRLKELISSAHVREKGRHGDFIMQELFREIGTINAKCADAEISQSAIALKMELEKIREQLCNCV